MGEGERWRRREVERVPLRMVHYQNAVGRGRQHTHPIFLWQQGDKYRGVRGGVCGGVCVRVFTCRAPFGGVAVGLLVGRQLDDENAGLGMFQTLLVAGGLWGALGVQHEDLEQQEVTSGGQAESHGPSVIR